MAATIGGEIARSIAEGLQGALARPADGQQPPPLAIDDGELREMREALEGQGEDVGTLKAENMDLKAKLGVMEAELVRLRKDRRELEKFLLDKIRKMHT
jgi:predicted RNase H-like nuclease (RuvC/YqgF family)